MITLTEAQQVKLRALLTDDPNGKGYQALLQAGMPGHVVDLLNDKTELMNREYWATSLTLMAELGVGMYRSIMTKLDAFASADIAVRDFVARIRSEKGADIGHMNTLNMIDELMAFPQPDGFTAEEGTALKALSLQPASEMDVNDLPSATEEMIREAQ